MKDYDQKQYLTLLLSNVDDWSNKEKRNVGVQVRSDYVIHYCIKGKGTFFSNGKIYNISAGQSFLIYPDATIDYYQDVNDPWEYAYADFTGFEARSIISMTGFTPENPVSPVLDANLLSIFEKMRLFFLTDNRANAYIYTTYLHALLAEYIRLFPNPNNNQNRENSSTAVNVMNYICNNYHYRYLSIEHIAEKFNISRNTLHRQFKDTYGISPIQFITHTRIKKACELLKTTTSTINIIANSVGFANSFYFSRVFKEQMGLTPNEYRIRKEMFYSSYPIWENPK